MAETRNPERLLAVLACALLLAACSGAPGGPDAGEPIEDAGAQDADGGTVDAGDACTNVRCDAPLAVCDPGTGACVACVEDLHCPSTRPACDAATRTCVVCTADEHCATPTPMCDLTVPGGACAGCASDADCAAPNPTCDPASRRCVTAADACLTAETITLSAQAPVTFTVDTTLLHDDATAYCSSPRPGGNHDAIYRFTLDEPRSVVVEARGPMGSQLDPVLYLRAAPCEGESLICADRTAAGASELLIARNLPAGEYFLIVEAFGEAQGVLEVTLSLPAGPPPNDQCAGAIALANVPGSQTVTFDTFLAEDDAAGSCGPSPKSPDGVFSLTLADPMNLKVVATGPSGVEPTLFLRSGTCAGTELGCKESTAGVATLGAALLPGTWFLFVESDAAGLPGLVSLTVELVSPGAGETCSAPTPLSIPALGSTQFSVDTSLAVDEEYSPYCSYTGTPDLVYALTLGQAQDVTLTVTPPAGSSADAILWARSGSCTDTAAEVDCVDKNFSASGETMTLLNMQPGTIYLFIETYTGSHGALDVTVTLSAPTVPPLGEECSNPAPIVFPTGSSVSSFSVDTTLAGDQHGSSCGSFGGEFVYHLALMQSATVTVTATAPASSSADPVLYLRSAPCLSGMELACVDAFGVSDTFTTGVLAPGDYYVFIETYGTYTGALDVTVETVP